MMMICSPAQLIQKWTLGTQNLQEIHQENPASKLGRSSLGMGKPGVRASRFQERYREKGSQYRHCQDMRATPKMDLAVWMMATPTRGCRNLKTGKREDGYL